MIYSSGVLAKRGNKVVFLPSPSDEVPEACLLHIQMTPSECTLTSSPSPKLWISAGYFEEASQHGIPLTTNSKFRLGSTLLTVQAAIHGTEVPEAPYVSNTDQDNYCRYCYDSFDTEKNPLFRPCHCTDSIHLKCFLEFIRKKFDWDYWKVGKQWKSARCEICHEELPLVFQHQGRYYYFCTDPDFVPPLLMMTQVDSLSSLPYCFLFKHKKKVEIFGNDTCLEYRNDAFYLRCSDREAQVYLEAPEEISMEQDMCVQVEEFQLKMMLRRTVKVKVVGPKLVRMVDFSNVGTQYVEFPPD